MACAPCTTPVTGNRSLPVSDAAYLVDSPVCSTPLDAGDACSLVTEPSYNSSCSLKKSWQEYVPGWVNKLLGWRKGKLILFGGSKGDALGFLDHPLPGPVQYDSDGKAFVGYQQTAGHLAGDAACVEDGLLPLAYLDKESIAESDGNVVETHVYRHGVQQVRNVGVGQMLGLTQDAFKGTVRQDVIEPEATDLVKTGIPSGMKRLAYAEEDVTNGCAISKVKRWFAVVGAAWTKDEIIQDKTSHGVEPSLIPTDTGFALGWRDMQTREDIADADASDYRMVVAKVTTDPENPDRITGFSKEFIALPPILEDGAYDALIARIEDLESA